METLLLPDPDTIPVAWGWFQLLLLVTFPLHLLAMNALVGGMAAGLYHHLRGGELRLRLAHRLAVTLPLVLALTVNLGVAPYLFLQVLYGQVLYTSSLLMGVFWLAIVPLLMLAYGAAYLYEFRFARLGRRGLWVICCSSVLLIVIAALFSNNMQLLQLPQRFGDYFNHMGGTMLVGNTVQFWSRYLHMLLSALAIGGLFVALLGRFRARQDAVLADHALRAGMGMFVWCTLMNIVAGVVYLVTLPRRQMLLFMGGDMGATVSFVVALLLTVAVVVVALRRKLVLTLFHVVALVYLMVFLRSWLRADALQPSFSLDQLQVVPHYSSMVFFFLVLVGGVVCLFWLYKKCVAAFATP